MHMSGDFLLLLGPKKWQLSEEQKDVKPETQMYSWEMKKTYVED